MNFNKVKKKLAIISTHPIQYNAPFFVKLAALESIDLMVFYTWDKGTNEKHDPGFGKKIAWDIPLLEGYNYTFVTNTSKNAGSHRFMGIQNPTLISEIKDFQPDAILVYGWCFRSHLQVLRYFKGKIPVWFRGDSTLLDYNYQNWKDVLTKKTAFAILSLIKFNLRRILLTWIYKHVDKAFYVGTNNKNYYLSMGLKESQLILLPHAVDNEFFKANNEEREKLALNWRQQLNIQDTDFVILFAGKLESKKNPELLLAAFIRLINVYKLINIHLIIVGDGILESQLKQKSDLIQNIHYLPFQNQTIMPLVYRLANVFCLPSKGPDETWGLALNEALACNRIVIASDKVGGAIDLIIENSTGFIFKNENTDDLCQTIKKAIISEKLGAKYKILNDHIDKFNLFKNASILQNHLNHKV